MQALVLAASLGSSEMMLSPIKSAPLLDFASATNTSAISNSTGAISTSAMGFYHDGKQGRLHGHLQPRVWKLIVCKTNIVLLSLGSKIYNVIFMVDLQFTVFCCEVGFVKIYVFLVLYFCGQICVCAFCNSVDICKFPDLEVVWSFVNFVVRFAKTFLWRNSSASTNSAT